ncbi:MAG: 3-phosphoshikimate 1-carboxyvinyltransferase, partial [Caulobacteraceae bacterium]
TQTSRPGRSLRGAVRPPSDKSISHRALILAALARGESRIEGLLESADVLATVEAVRALGAEVERMEPGAWRLIGKGRFETPAGVIDCGNSGTAARLLLGAAAGFPITVTFDGDASLRKRPMRRVTEPLGQMGAAFDGEHLPLSVTGGNLSAVTYRLPVASAQVKSAVLLAGLNARGVTTVIEPHPTRDHTERMLGAFGAPVTIELSDRGERAVMIEGGRPLHPARITVPADPSSAAFPLVAALITPGSEVKVQGVLLNPLRMGLIHTLLDMGADLSITHERQVGGETVGDITARTSALRGVAVPAERAPSMIDEYPILAIAAAFASGETRMEGLAELRAKESDRIAAVGAGLEACGVDVEEEPEGLIVRGSGAPPRGGGVAETHHDHRIAMSFLVMGLAAREAVTVDGALMISTSFPDFSDLMRGLGADID